MSDAKLLPCPFCAGEAEWKSGGPGCAWISCKSCPAETGDGSVPRLLDAWNTRADAAEIAALQARIDAERAKVEKLVEAAEDMATVAEQYEWDKATTGRQIILAALRAAITAAKGE